MQPSSFCVVGGTTTSQPNEPPVLTSQSLVRPLPTGPSGARYAHSGPPTLAQSLVLSRLSLSPTLLPSNLASLITAISLAARVSIRASALFIEAILESAKYSTIVGLGLTRRALISAVGSARALHYVNASLDWSGRDSEGKQASDAFLQVLDKYTSLGVYLIHHTFTLAELFAMSGFYLTMNVVNTGFSAAEESVRIIDGVLGSNETSRALASIITLVRSELTQDSRFSPAERGAITSLASLTKALTAFVCLQVATHRRTLREQRLRVVYDCTIVVEAENERDFSIDEFTRRRNENAAAAAPAPRERERTPSLMTDVRTELEATGGRVPRSRQVSVQEEVTEIVSELAQMCGSDDEDMRDEDGDELPEAVRAALSEVQDGGDGKRVVRSGSSDFDYEIEEMSTTTTTTTVVRTISSNSALSGPARTISRRTKDRPAGQLRELGPGEAIVEEGQEQDEWVELSTMFSDGNRTDAGEDEIDDVSELPSADNGVPSLATLTRQDTLDHPAESKERLQVVLRKMTKTFTQRKRTIRRVDLPSQGNSPAESPRSKSVDRHAPKNRRRDVRELEWPGGAEDVEMTPETPDETKASRSKTKPTGPNLFRAFSKALKRVPSGDGPLSRNSPSSSSAPSAERTPPATPRQPSFSSPSSDTLSSSAASSHGLSAPIPPVPPLPPRFAASPPVVPTQRTPLVHPTLSPPQPSGASTGSSSGPAKSALPPRLRRPASTQSMRSVLTTTTHSMQTPEEPEPKASNFPRCHLVKNLQTFMRYSSAAYGQAFLRILGIGKHDFNFPHTQTHANNHAFAHHVGISVDDILLSSYTDAGPTAFSTSKITPLINYVAVDHSLGAIVLACRGSLGLSDLLVDLTCAYEPIPIEHGDPHASYYVHSGMFCSATTMQRGTVHDTIREALLAYPTYGLVLCGHSLGGGVAALLAILWSSPSHAFERQVAQKRLNTGMYPNYPRITTPFVTSLSSGFPPGRPISCFSFGPPCVASPDLTRYCRGLVISSINGFDIVPTLSLGVLRDLKNMAMGLSSEAGTAEEIVGRTIGLYQRRFMANRAAAKEAPPTGEHEFDSKASLTEASDEAKEVPLSMSEIDAGKGGNRALDPAYRDPSLLGPEISDDAAVNDWMWSLVKTMRAGNDNEKLYPPGDVYNFESWTVFISNTSQGEGSNKAKYSRREGRRVVLRHVDNVETRFGEPVFGRTMMSDHSPVNYEQCLELLATAVLG